MDSAVAHKQIPNILNFAKLETLASDIKEDSKFISAIAEALENWAAEKAAKEDKNEEDN